MNHRQKVAQHIREMSARGINRFTTAPPIYRILWLLGIKVRPPFFQTPTALKRTLGCGMAVVAFVAISLWKRPHDPGEIAMYVLGAIGVAAAVGTQVAQQYTDLAKGMTFPRWEDYPEPAIKDAEAPPPSA
ncbi:DUF6404 family protein [Singulisphaera sp. PoT]|uniref:DUF6404 family protein n=1 Tax=Singulisphaera sp. PoT TaxID=3411797 RepID=UPI003BF606CE